MRLEIPELSETLSQLESVGEGTHRVGIFGGYLHIKQVRGAWRVMWTTGRETSTYGTALQADFWPDGVGCVWAQAITMWITRDDSERLKIARLLATKIKSRAKQVLH